MTTRVTIETNNWPARVSFADQTGELVPPQTRRIFTVTGDHAVTVQEVEPEAGEAEQPPMSEAAEAPILSLRGHNPASVADTAE